MYTSEHFYSTDRCCALMCIRVAIPFLCQRCLGRGLRREGTYLRSSRMAAGLPLLCATGCEGSKPASLLGSPVSSSICQCMRFAITLRSGNPRSLARGKMSSLQACYPLRCESSKSLDQHSRSTAAQQPTALTPLDKRPKKAAEGTLRMYWTGCGHRENVFHDSSGEYLKPPDMRYTSTPRPCRAAMRVAAPGVMRASGGWAARKACRSCGVQFKIFSLSSSACMCLGILCLHGRCCCACRNRSRTEAPITKASHCGCRRRRGHGVLLRVDTALEQG